MKANALVIFQALITGGSDFRITLIHEGYYYLVDAGYTNCEGFLAPYRATRYHLSEWGEGRLAPATHEEFFNTKHYKVRNVI